MEKNNGKIAIAIVAMFVVALSVVGFTYAYFVAQVQGNTNTSVTVTAGTLSVAYASTQEIKAENLVPGWQSDGLHYFDDKSYNSVGDEIRYNACVKESEVDEGEVYNASTNPTGTRNVACDDSKAIPANGAKGPAIFTVTNDSTARANESTVSYVIILNGISNGLADSDTNENTKFHYALCKGTCPTVDKYSDLPGVGESEVLVSKGEISATDKVQVISSVQVLDKNDTTSDVLDSQTYNLMLYYDDAASNQDGTGKSVSAKIDIVGVAQNGENWYDANGVQVTPLPAGQQ